MDYHLTLKRRYLWLPVAAGRPKRMLEIFADGVKKLELQIPCGNAGCGTGSNADCGTEYQFDYYAPIRCGDSGCGLCPGEITFHGEFPDCFYRAIRQEDENPPTVGGVQSLHFHAGTGWLNDPNGLVFQNGLYHLYFQYNPFDTEWDNMSWGHAVSRDLLHWEQRDTVLLPDGNGMIFSGCGLRNDRGCLGLPKDALLFFYTAAGGKNSWSRNRAFVQKLAYSLDGGETLIKAEDWKMPAVILEKNGEKLLCRENRDPKVFWHEPTGDYVMTLWLCGNEFGIFTSPDLREFTLRQTLTLEEAWECPDLLYLSVEGEEEGRWVFWSADGFYFPGDFDGKRFAADGYRLEAYASKLPYAAQTWSGTEGRVVSIPWLRTRNTGKNYRGVMGLPRELSLCRTRDGLRLVQRVAREWKKERRQICAEEGVSSLALDIDAVKSLSGTEPGFVGNNASGDGNAENAAFPTGAFGIYRPLEIECRMEELQRRSVSGLEPEELQHRSVSGLESEEESKGFRSLELEACGTKIVYLPGERKLIIGTESVSCPEELRELSVIFDGEIIEITGNSGIMSAVLEREPAGPKGPVRIQSEVPVDICLYVI